MTLLVVGVFSLAVILFILAIMMRPASRASIGSLVRTWGLSTVVAGGMFGLMLGASHFGVTSTLIFTATCAGLGVVLALIHMALRSTSRKMRLRPAHIVVLILAAAVNMIAFIDLDLYISFVIGAVSSTLLMSGINLIIQFLHTRRRPT